ncbi:retrovirus-related pol polyprotein from transposon TNT 1-94, partial [Tanacetum coccineum]
MAFVSGSPPAKKAQTEGIVISDSRPSTAGKSPTALRRLIRQDEQATAGSGSAAAATEDVTSSSVTPTQERALEDASRDNVRTCPPSGRFVVLSSGSADTDIPATSQVKNQKFSFQRVKSLFEDLRSELRYCSELGSELTLLAGSELKTSELDTSELKTSEYRFLKIFILASYEQELCATGYGGAQNRVGNANPGQARQNRGQGNNTRGVGATGYRGAQNRVGNANPGQAKQVKCYNYNDIGHIARNCTQPKRSQNSEYFKDKMLLMQAQENGVALDEEQLLFISGGQDNVVDEDVDEQPVQDLALNVDNVFQADDCDAFDSDVDEAPTAQIMFMENLSSAGPIYDEASPSYDSDILSEVVQIVL